MDPYLLYLLTGIPSSHPDFNQTPPFLSSKELIVPSTPERQTVSRNSQMSYLPHNPLQHPLNTVEPKQVVTTDGVLSETIFNSEIILPHSSVDESSIRPRIQNVVSTVDLECKLDLNRIAEKARNAEYNPKRFSAVVMRIREPKSTALIFNSGKIVCLGTKSEESAKLASRKFARILQKIGYKVKFGEFKVQNMVGSCDVKFQIRLELLSISLRKFSHFEPEVFPGLVCKMVDPKVTILIFASGKVVITGAKKADDTMEAFQKIYSVVKHFKKA